MTPFFKKTTASAITARLSRTQRTQASANKTAKKTPKHNTKQPAQQANSRTSRHQQAGVVKAGTQFGHPQLSHADTDNILREAGLSRSDLAALLYDDEISGCVQRRELAVLGNPWHIKGLPDTGMHWLTDNVQQLFDHAVRAIMRANWLGSSIAELVWKDSDNGLIIDAIVPRPIERFKRTAKGLVFTDDYRNDIVVMPEKVLLTGINVHEDNPYGDALLSRVYWAWFNKNYGEQFWSKFTERHASPLTIGQFDVNAGDADAAQQQLTEHAVALAGAVAAGVVAVGKEDDIAFVDANNNGEAHEKFVKHQIQRIQKTLIGRVLTPDLSSGAGSRAAQETDDRFYQGIRDADVALCEAGLNHIIHTLLTVNGFDSEGVSIVFNRDKRIDEARWKRDVALLNTGQVRFTEQYFVDTYGLSAGQFALLDSQQTTDKA